MSNCLGRNSRLSSGLAFYLDCHNRDKHNPLLCFEPHKSFESLSLTLSLFRFQSTVPEATVGVSAGYEKIEWQLSVGAPNEGWNLRVKWGRVPVTDFSNIPRHGHLTFGASRVLATTAGRYLGDPSDATRCGRGGSYHSSGVTTPSRSETPSMCR